MAVIRVREACVRWGWMIAAVAATLAASGCGSSDDSHTEASVPPTQPGMQPRPPAVPLGPDAPRATLLPRPYTYDLTLSIDSVASLTGNGYNVRYYPASGTMTGTMTGTLALGILKPERYVQPRFGPSSLIPATFDSVTFQDSVTGQAQFDSAGVLYVNVFRPFTIKDCCIYDSFYMIGILDSARFVGTWSQATNPHFYGLKGRLTGVRR